MSEHALTPQDADKLFLQAELDNLHDPENGSAIEGPLRPIIVKVGEIATYVTFSALKLFKQPEENQRTPRNAWLD